MLPCHSIAWHPLISCSVTTPPSLFCEGCGLETYVLISLLPRPNPLTRKGFWWPLSNFMVVPSQQSWYWTTQWNSTTSCNHMLNWPTDLFIVSCPDSTLTSVALLKSHDWWYLDLAQPRNCSMVTRPFSSWEGGVWTHDYIWIGWLQQSAVNMLIAVKTQSKAFATVITQLMTLAPRMAKHIAYVILSRWWCRNHIYRSCTLSYTTPYDTWITKMADMVVLLTIDN